jgi:2',3'-cyclic-nucleotide 2'-phosphodiesterase (5'-nucleotidase family)
VETTTTTTAANTFLTNWFGTKPPAGLQIGTYSGVGAGLSTAGDAVNIYNAAGTLQTNLVFGASPTASPFATFDNTALLNNATTATLSAVGTNGAFSITNSRATEIGSPGTIKQAPAYTLQLLHFYGESGLLGVETAPILGALVDRFDDQYSNTLVLAEGDTYIPGPWLVGGSDPSLNGIPGIGTTAIGRPDIAILNALGTNASALGNHEFDLGSPVLAGAIAASGTGATAYPGAQFPFITTNLTFAADSALRGLADATLGGTATNDFAGKEAAVIKGKIAPYTVVTKGGEKIGIVGATTYDLLSKSSPNGTVPKDDGIPTTDDLQEVAAYIQTAVDALRATGVNKIVLVDQLDTIERNKALAPLVSGIDVMVAGGGHERLGDATDRAVGFNGHSADFVGTYPIVTAGADGKPTLIVTTDTEYSYLGRLVVDFNANGEIILPNLDPVINGAYASTEANLQAAYGTTQTAKQIIASSTIGTNVSVITNAIDNVIRTKDSNIFGYTKVYLEGDRAFGRAQEVNLGDISADANIFKAQAALGSGAVLASLKNGGGLRSSVGLIGEDGEKLPPAATSVKPVGGISQLDIENALRFDNKLIVFDTTPQGLLNILNYAAGLAPGNGGYAQIGGVQFSYDPTKPVGQRVQDIAINDLNGNLVARIADNGVLLASAPAKISVVTLNFTANGGDGYPIKANADNFRYLLDNGTLSAPIDKSLDFTAAANLPPNALGEQKAFQDFLQAFHNTPAKAYNIVDTPATLDQRIQNLQVKTVDTVFSSLNQAPTGITLSNRVATIAENTSTTSRTRVADIGITDDGKGTNVLSLIGADAGSFELVGNALFLKAGTVLDFETKNSFGVTVNVNDPAVGTNPDATINFGLAVTDVNEAPTAVVVISSIAENTSTVSRTRVAELAITDDALGTNTLSLSGADAGSFELAGNALFLRAGTILDFEAKNSFGVAVNVNDPTVGATPDATVNFRLAVTDVNEAPTAVVISNAVTSIAENTSTISRTKVADLAVTDDALGTNTLSLSGADAGSFELDGNALFLKAGTALNFEAKNSFGLTVNVNDPAVGTNPDATINFALAVTDVNEAPTAIVVSNAVTSIAENTSTTNRTKVADLAITDDALGTNTLSLSGTDAGSFELDGNALFLRAGTALNFEAKNSFGLTVNVNDPTVGATPDATVNFALAVTDVNEAPTAIVISNAVTSIAENTSTISRTKVADLAVTDDALGTNTLSLSGADAGSFELDGNSLFLKAGTALNFEAKNSFGLAVNVNDPTVGTNPDATVNFALAVTDVNEAPTAVVVSNAVTSIAENTSTTTRTRVANLAVTDDALGTNTLSLSGADAGSFELDGNALFLRAGTALNFEAKNSFGVTVNVNDPAVGTNPDATVNFALAVTDVNEAPTAVVVSNAVTSIAENTSTTSRTKVADLAVTDDALGTNTLSLTGTDAGSFELDGNALFLKAGTALNFEAKNSFGLTVNVNDPAVGTNPDATVNFALIVTDVNEAPTAVVVSNAVTSIAENTSTTSRTRVADLAITDDALGTNTLSLTGADAGSFELAGNALFLRAGTALNFEAKNSFGVTVNVNDPTVGATPDATVNFALAVTDVNEAPTAVVISNAVTSIAENTSTTSRTKVADLAITDDALGTNTLSLTGADAGSFELAGNALFLRAGTALNFEAKNSFGVTVNVNDPAVGATPDATVNFALAVTDVNEAPTAILFNNPVLTLAENVSTASRTKVADVAITDDALGTNVLNLSGSDAASFELDGSVLFLKAGVALNFDVKNSLSVTVNADDTTVGVTPDVSKLLTLNIANVNNLVSGTPGADRLDAGITPGFSGISDTVFTGAGNDRIDAVTGVTGNGNNRIDAGSGNDLIYIADADRVFGSTGDDVLDATDAKDYRASGGAGNDTFYLGTNGKSLGGDGNDKFYAGAGGGNTISGGAGVDQFWITNAELPKTANTILDFQIDTDVIGIQGIGATAANVVLNQVGADTTISSGGQTLAILKGIQSSSLTLSNASQFVFA